MPSVKNPKYVSSGDIRATYKVSPSTIRNWANKGTISCKRSPGGKRLYSVRDIHAIFGTTPEEEDADARIGRKYIYARVSCSHQKEDLTRQVSLLREKYPDHVLAKDVGSGLNWKRKAFKTLLDDVFAHRVSEVVVTHKDRLARFAVDLLQWIFDKHGVKFVVLDKTASPEHTTELADDLLAVTTFFVARNNGRRSAPFARQRAADRRREGQTSGRELAAEEDRQEARPCQKDTDEVGTGK